MKAGSLRRIRHSSDPLDLSWVGQLHRPDGPPDGTREEDLSSAAGCHPPLHHLREQQQRALFTSSSYRTETTFDATVGPHLELKPLSINAKLLHQRDGGGLQHVHLQATDFKTLEHVIVFRVQHGKMH